jgi:hypothetical protein
MSRYWKAWLLIAAIPLALLAPLLLLLVTGGWAWFIVSAFLGGVLGVALNEIRCPSCGLGVIARPVRIGKDYLEISCFPSRCCRECGSSL